MPNKRAVEHGRFIDLSQKINKAFAIHHPKHEQILKLLEDESDEMIAMLLNAPFTYTMRLFRLLDIETQSRVLKLVNTHTLQTVIKNLTDDMLIELIAQSTPALRNKLLKHIDHLRVPQLAPKLSEAILEKLAHVVNYPKRSVGRMMETDLLTISLDATVKQAKDIMEEEGQLHTPSIQLYVVSGDQHKFVGVLPIVSLFGISANEPIEPLVLRHVPTLTSRTTQDTAGELFQSYGVSELPVVDDGHLLGRVLVESVFEILQQQYSEQMQKMAGIQGSDETILTPALPAARRRLPWMLVNIGFNLLSVTAVMPFQATIAELTALAVIMPILSDMSGNVGIQALTVGIRSVQHTSSGWQLLVNEIFKELQVGLINGALLGLVVGSIAFLIWRNPMLSLVAGGALLTNTINASLLGGTLPIVFRKLKLDPALMSGAVLTTITDFAGFLLLLGLATILL